MKRCLLLLTALALTSCAPFGSSPSEKLSFVVSFEHPETHFCQVDFHCEGIKGDTHDFTIPAWMPGDYRIQNYYRNITNFSATDADGHALTWAKSDTNTWRVQCPGAHALTVSYSVASGQAAAQSSMSTVRGFISPCDTYMYFDGKIMHPVTVTIKLKDGWTNIATGLDPVRGQANTYYAPDFDVLYDCPTLLGNIEFIPFEVKGIHHEMAGINLGEFDRVKFASDLKRMVESATTLMGDIGYQHYTFMVAGQNAGIEHLDETTLPFTGADVGNATRNKHWLDFVAHEYFHNYNVKRIRPIALGPFDYEHENHTYMLWVSEGFTDYYAWIVLRRAGLLEMEDVLNGTGGQRGFGGLAAAIGRFENIPGHLYQSAATASWESWNTGGFGAGRGARLNISYYEKGNVVGTLLDLKIRHESQNKKSLDDVMRGLYKEYFREKKRGFTDQEFREMCERMAGTKLDEVFEYAYTTKPVDYPKYFNYAGLDIAMPKESTNGDFGAVVRDSDGKLTVSAVEPISSAAEAGLAAQDIIVSADGATVDAATFNDLINPKKAGDQVTIIFTHAGTAHTAKITLGHKFDRGTFKITAQPNPDALQAAIRNDWLRATPKSL